MLLHFQDTAFNVRNFFTFSLNRVKMEEEEDGPVTQQPFSAKSSPAPIVKPGIIFYYVHIEIFQILEWTFKNDVTTLGEGPVIL